MKLLRKFVFEYSSVLFLLLALVVLGYMMAHADADRPDLKVVFMVAGTLAIPVAVVRGLLTYCERAGVKEGGLWLWILRFVFWVVPAVIFSIGRNDCGGGETEGVFIAAVLTVVTGSACCIEVWLRKANRPNKASEPTATIPPPSATPPAPLAHL